MFELINTITGESHGEYPSREQALGCAAYDRLTQYEIIWNPQGPKRPRRKGVA